MGAESLVGYDLYVNNYIPVLGVNAPIGQPGCEFRGGTLDSLMSWAGSTGLISLEGNSFAITEGGERAGYLDVSRGSTISFPAGESGPYTISIPEIDLSIDGIPVNSRSTPPLPPHVLSRMEPQLFLNPTLGPNCGTVVELEWDPGDIVVEAGATVTISNGRCLGSGPASKQAWEQLRDTIEFYWEKRNPAGEWERIDEESNEDLLINSVSCTDAGSYRYGYVPLNADHDCAFISDTRQRLSAPFEIVVSEGGEIAQPPVSNPPADMESGSLLFLNVTGPVFGRDGELAGSEV